MPKQNPVGPTRTQDGEEIRYASSTKTRAGVWSDFQVRQVRQAVCVWSDSGQKKSDVSDQTRLSAKSQTV
jgi:hypothetical protein